MTKATIVTQDTIEEPVDVLVLPKIKDRAASPATTGEDPALVHQPPGDEEKEKISTLNLLAPL